MVILAHVQQAAVLLLADAVNKLDVIVALVLVAGVGDTAAPLELGHHVTLATAIGGIERNRSGRILVAKFTFQFQHGQPREGDVSGNDPPIHLCHERE